MQIYLRDDLETAIESGALGPMDGSRGDVFAALSTLQGQIYRLSAVRSTSRVVVAGKAYFAKVHHGVGWREIAKNLVAGKRPVLGARNEFEACRRLRAHDVRAPDVAAFAQRGINPSTRRSVVLCDALEGFVSLEDVGNGWTVAPPEPGLKRRLLASVARLTAAMHGAGVTHRDYYACHLMVDPAKLGAGQVELAVIDLHRAEVRDRTPRRARRRDLAALLYSVSAMPLTRADRLRFVAAYVGDRPATELRRHAGFWNRVARRAERLRKRAAARGYAAGRGVLGVAGDEAPSIGNLADLGRAPPLPFRFDVDLGAGGVRAVCREVLRSQPGQRLVMRADLAGREVILKAFFGHRGARNFKRERRGVARFHAAGIATPEVLGAGRGAGARLLALEPIGASAPCANDAGSLLAMLARMHSRGIRQRDLHIDNFLLRGGEVLAIDGAGVARTRTVGQRRRLADIASLLAHFRSDELPPLTSLARCYDAAGDDVAGCNESRLRALVGRAWQRRIAKWTAKTLRECTAFEVRREADRLVVVARGDTDPALREVIADPERAMTAGETLKRGNTATAIAWRGLVVKRYAIKNRLHRWRGKLRASRARRAWRAGHGLRLAGVATPRPRALIETFRPGVGDATAYLVLDQVQGVPLDQAVAGSFDPRLAKALRTMFRDFRGLRFGHGDMKATNFIVDGAHVHLLDLDAAGFRRSTLGFARRHRRDCERFLDNWHGAPAWLREVVEPFDDEPVS